MRDFFADEDDSANDPAHEALLQALADMVDAEDMLKKGGALSNILLRAFEEAKDALSALVDTPTADDTIRALQSQVRRYGDLVRWTRDIINEGQDAAKQLDDGAREEILNMTRGEDDHDYID